MKKFKAVGLEMLLPRQAKSDESSHNPCMVIASMHYLPYPFWVPLDATVFVEIYITRMPIGKLEEEINDTKESDLFKESSSEENECWFWLFTFDEKTTRFDSEGDYTYYRRDVRLDNGEIFHAYAEVLNGGSKESIEADHAAVRRIFNSIKPLGKKHAKK